MVPAVFILLQPAGTRAASKRHRLDGLRVAVVGQGRQVAGEGMTADPTSGTQMADKKETTAPTGRVLKVKGFIVWGLAREQQQIQEKERATHRSLPA